MRDGQHQALLDFVVSQGNHPAPPSQKPEWLQKPAELLLEETPKELPQDRKLLYPFGIRFSEAFKIGLLRNQLYRQVNVAQSLHFRS